MTIPVVAFFNNKGGVGKTSLVFHLAWMFDDLGLSTMVADLDPQANLTAAFVEEDRLERFWDRDGSQPTKRRTIFGMVSPLMSGTGDVDLDPYLVSIGDNTRLLAGDLALSRFEEDLSQEWPQCLDGRERSFRVVSALSRVIQAGAEKHGADVVLIDLGPNLGALNRAALIAANDVAFPLTPDLFSLQGLRNLGPTLREWRHGWQERLDRAPGTVTNLPTGDMNPIGYIVLQHAVRLDRPARAYGRWVSRIPAEYQESILGESASDLSDDFAEDPHCLGLLKHYRSLMPMSQEARKPIFHLRPADGAIGAHQNSVRDARKDFTQLAKAVLGRVGVPV